MNLGGRTRGGRSSEVIIDIGDGPLPGSLTIPSDVIGLVVFAHGSGSSRASPRNRAVADLLCDAGLATLLFDLLTARESEADELTATLRFDIHLLGARLTEVVDWLSSFKLTMALPICLFGASTGAAAALRAAAARPKAIAAVVSRGGRPDLAEDGLPYVIAPTLLIVGGEDLEVIEMNRQAARELKCEWRMSIVPGATHLFEEPGKLDQAAKLARDWFLRYLGIGGESNLHAR
jgi:putative phosphoribosyl transferase